MQHHSVTLTMLLLVVWALGGCAKDDNPADPGDGDEIINNLFPLAAGRTWVSTAYELDTLGVKIENTTHRDVLYTHSALVYDGKPAFLMVDSIYHPGGTFNYVDTTYMATDSTGKNLYLHLGEWVPVFKLSEGLNTEYTAAFFPTDYDGFDVDLLVRCKILPKEEIIVPKGKVQAYKLEIRYTISLFIISFEERLNVWFAEGIGPVKFQTPPPVDIFTGQKSNGRESVLVSTNF